MAREPVARYARMLAALGAEPRLRIFQLLLAAHPDGLVVGEIMRQAGISIEGGDLLHPVAGDGGRPHIVGYQCARTVIAAGPEVTGLRAASSDAKLARLITLGLDHGINYRTSDTVAEVRGLTGGHGADVILDTIGGPVLQDSLRCLAYRGRCISADQAGRAPAAPSISRPCGAATRP